MIILKPDLNAKTLFLAGPIQGAPDWHKEVEKELFDKNVILFSPKREDDMNFDYNEQVDWETAHLITSDILVFYLAKEKTPIPGRSYAQTTRFEIAENLARILYTGVNQKVIIFCDPKFHGGTYIKEKVETYYKDFASFYNNKEDFYKQLKALL